MSDVPILESGIKLLGNDFFNGLACMAGLTGTHEWPLIKTDKDLFFSDLEREDICGFFVCRTPNPGLFGYQRGIDGVTHSGAGHSGFLAGKKVAELVRIRRPSLLVPKVNARWKNRPVYHPPIITEGIPPKPQRLEIVESQFLVAINSLTASVDKGEQVIVFTNPLWTLEQKVAMACEAYTWVGEPYDVFEVGSWFLSWMFNPAQMNVCSTLVQKCVSAGDRDIDLWARFHKLNPDKVAPRDLLAYGVDRALRSWCYNTELPGVITAEAKKPLDTKIG